MAAKTINEMNVLIVDDDRHMRMLIRNVLFALGVNEVYEASDGEAALDEIKTFTPHLILCDLKMDPVGGIEFVSHIRTQPESPYRFVPVIMITAYADMDAVADARDVGINEFMAKPVSAAALEKRIARVIEDSRQFVEAPDFLGPDRRRNTKGGFGGQNRREAEPNYLKPPESKPAKT